MFGVNSTLMFCTLSLIIAAGLIYKYLNRNDPLSRITTPWFAAAAGVILVIIAPGVSFLGTKMAQSDAVGGYKEFWNGSLKIADSKTITCTRDGSCRHTYWCDPYLVTIDDSYYDSDGNYHHSSHTETRWHDCPYVTQETTYWVDDTFGDEHVLGKSWFDEQPKAWKKGKEIPSDVPRGVPPQWESAKANIDAGDPDPVTKVMSYKNYLLASQETLLKQYSDQIDKYQEAGLLPEHTKNMLEDPIHDSYMADKVVFTGGMKVDNYQEWQDALGRLNSRLGNERQGDLHILIVPADTVDNPDEYMSALLAYWQSDTFGKKALSKNTIVMAVGVDQASNTVVWARAKTGVPEGNGGISSAVMTELPGLSLEPRTLIGWPKANVTGDDLTFTPSSGKIESIVLTEFPFLRPCMECKDEGDNGSGYVYLKRTIHVSAFGQVFMCFIIALLAAGTFWVGTFLSWSESDSNSYDNDSGYGRSRYQWPDISTPPTHTTIRPRKRKKHPKKEYY